MLYYKCYIIEKFPSYNYLLLHGGISYMGLLTAVILNFLQPKYPNTFVDKKYNYIYYKIVDSTPNDDKYILQCINTNAIFHIKIEELVLDLDILHFLHPIQACYVGIEYAKVFKNRTPSMGLANLPENKHEKYVTNRYGRYTICYQDRKGNICFADKKTKEEFWMDPRDIALSKETIQEFDAAQTFYIGLLTGLKLENPTTSAKISNEAKPSHLRVIK